MKFPHSLPLTALRPLANRTRCACVATILVTASLQPSAATVALVDGRLDVEKYISISGQIEQGDLDRLQTIAPRALYEGGNTLTLTLNSQGGDVDEAIKIGRWARSLMATVIVSGTIVFSPDTEAARLLYRRHGETGFQQLLRSAREPLKDSDLVRCQSSCVLILYGGASRRVSDNLDTRAGPKHQKTFPVIGLHRPHYEKVRYGALNPAEAQALYSRLEKDVRAYLQEMGAPTALADRMLRKASSDIDLVPESEFAKMYQSREPFLDEWLIARCGAFGAVGALNKEEARAWFEHRASLKQAVDAGRFKSVADFEGFSSASLSAGKAADLEKKIHEFNSENTACRNSSIRRHQLAAIKKP